MVPSSPYVPCSTGSTTSSLESPRPSDPGDERLASSRRHRPARVGSPTMVTSQCSPADKTACGSSAVASRDISQRPSLEIAIGTMSYLDGSMALITDSADRKETSCSPERPPNMTPTRSLEEGVWNPGSEGLGTESFLTS